MVCTESGAGTLRGIKGRHTVKRRHSITFAVRKIHTAGFPIRLKILGKDILFGLPAFCIGIIEAILQIGITRRSIRLHDTIVETIHNRTIHRIRHAIDYQQASGTRFRTDILAHGIDQLGKQSIVMSDKRP